MAAPHKLVEQTGANPIEPPEEPFERAAKADAAAE